MERENNEAGKEIMKRRLLVLIKLLYEQTDEDHQMDTFRIIDYLDEQGVPANRKTLKKDMEVLVDAGLDIVTVKSKPNRYFWGDRAFELPELKLLIDAVSSSRFITQKKSRELGRKLADLASINQRQELQRHIYATNRVKTNNEEIYYTVDAINRAITKRKKISFKYSEYDIDKKMQFRNGGEPYILSPYALLWNEDFYYVVGYSDKHENISVFRVDRMYKPEVLDQKAVKRPNDFDLDDYSNRMFDMYVGEKEQVRLECKSGLMKYIIDRFGEGVPVQKAGPDKFIATVNVGLSPPFYGWVFQFGGGVKIISPERAVEEMSAMAEAMLEK